MKKNNLARSPMESYLFPAHYDLVTPDGHLTSTDRQAPDQMQVKLFIQNISPAFVGFSIDKEYVSFNLKSALGQLGLHGITLDFELDRPNLCAEVSILLKAYGKIARTMLDHLFEGSYIGKLFAADPKRIVRNPDYLMRMFGRADRQGRPLLSLGGPKGKDELLLEKIDGRTIAFLQLQEGILSYDQTAIYGLLPTIGKALTHPTFRLRTLVQLDQSWLLMAQRKVIKDEILLVRT